MILGDERDAKLVPVMTFKVNGHWLAVCVTQVDRIATASHLWPIPFAISEHLGLYDTGQELVSVLKLDKNPERDNTLSCKLEQLLIILQVRGETVGMVIDKAGRVYDSYEFDDTHNVAPPPYLAGVATRRLRSFDNLFWLVDADGLFAPTSETAASMTVL